MKYEKIKLSDLVDTVSDTRKINKDKVVLINTSDIFDGDVLNHSYTDNSNLRGQFKKRFEKNDILYSEIRPANKRFAYIDFDSEDYIASTKLMVLRKRSNSITNRFLYYCLTNDFFTEKMQHLAEARSGTFPQITFDVLKNESINVPSIENQNKITMILDNINNKIKSNNEINNNLYEMGDNLYNEYFGKYKDNLPSDYKIVKLNEVADNYDSKRKPMSSREREQHRGIYPYYGATSIIDYVDDYIFDDIYLLMGEDGTVKTNDGYPVLQYIWGKNWINNHAHVLKGKNISTELLMFALRKINIENIITGAVQPKINQENMNKIEFVIGSDSKNKELEDILKILMDKSKNIIEENKKLEELRDTLLPKLMNGEIDLDNIEI